MNAHLTEIWRHPIKAIGRERVALAHLAPGACLPWDRHWAVAHEAARLEAGWASCRNFLRAAGAPELMAVTCSLDEAREEVSLEHPGRPPLTVSPDHDPGALLEWIAPLIPENRPQPSAVYKAERGLTDNAAPTITLCNHASHRSLEARLGHPLARTRWRGNLWIEGLVPWEEFDWVGRKLRLGAAELEVIEPTTRCRATEANPETGKRDTNTLALLSELGHQDFSVQAVVTHAGKIAEGDRLELL